MLVITAMMLSVLLVQIFVVPVILEPTLSTGNIQESRIITKEGNFPVTFLDGCENVYIDVGANIGIHGRKVFEGNLYPSFMQDYFDTYFGSKEYRNKPGNVCIVGFEMNPAHTKRLLALSECYTHMGHKMFYFTETAVSNRDNDVVIGSGMVKEYGGERDSYLGARVINNEKAKGRNDTFLVSTINLARFVKAYVKNRKHTGNGTVLMKMDIEGAEIDALNGMLAQGALCDIIDAVTIEWHKDGMIRNFVDNLNTTTNNTFGCKMPVFIKADDESYLRDGKPRPQECSHIDIPLAPNGTNKH